ncbi:PAQR family membrane homeostasis protein TrhA [Oceanomicrobium pacificus]|uniref:Hly-III family protein n=1 Tax=Oceanomicrobium pacificus TaxID=2692916 RepID=A0A6B0TQ35_9RHOB|nr:hemolysin III family protein [Oceanomicrobium pacificus]MXU66757.1 Hly-III family protein [Oceanomicrobium pacificus]
MFEPVTEYRDYSRAERLSDAVVHIVGLTAALMAVPVLITLAAVWRGDAAAVLSTSIYGACLIAMLGCSALYHLAWRHRWRGLFMRLDYSAIYFKIAGTYTPFILLSASPGWALLTGLWGAAIAGTSLRVLQPDRFRWLAIGLCLAMGWAGLIEGASMFETLSWPVTILIVIGGLTYTVGIIFHVNHRMPFHTPVWHVFVLAATAVFFAAVILHLEQTS